MTFFKKIILNISLPKFKLKKKIFKFMNFKIEY